MSRGPKSEKRPADVIGASCQNGLARPIARAVQALGEGQKSEGAGSEA
jgi:hypothetical protein